MQQYILDNSADLLAKDFCVITGYMGYVDSELMQLSTYHILRANDLAGVTTLTKLGFTLLLATGIEFALWVIVKLGLHRSWTHQQACVANYSYLVSNGGLIGTPVIEGLFGGVGVMYCNVFLIPTRIMALAAGESIFRPTAKKTVKGIVTSILKNQVIIAMAAALLVSFLGITIPMPIHTSLKGLGRCMSPLSLVLIGSMLAQKMHLTSSLLKKVLTISLVRLILIPIAVLILCRLIGLDFQTTAISVLLLGMPAGSTVAIFAKKYKSDTAFASAVVFLTTLLSIVTLVGLMAVMELIYHL